MVDWVTDLRACAVEIEKAAQVFEAFMGTDSDEHVENLRDAARQLREDASEYQNFNS